MDKEYDMDDDGDFGAFGHGFEDEFQPVNDSYENLINYIQSQGVHSAIAQMQAADDAGGAGGGLSVRTGDLGWSPQGLDLGGPIQLSSPNGSPLRGMSFHLGNSGTNSLDGSSSIPPLGPPGPQSAADLGNSVLQGPVNLQDATPKYPNQRNTNIAGGGTDQSAALAALAADPAVSSALDDAWAQSRPNGYIDQRQEINAFGRQNAAGDIWIEPANTPFGDSNISIVPTPPGSGVLGKLADGLSGNKTIFVIHTHPNPGDSKITGPSPEDVDYAKNNNIPLIIQSTDGLHFYDPGQHQ